MLAAVIRNLQADAHRHTQLYDTAGLSSACPAMYSALCVPSVDFFASNAVYRTMSLARYISILCCHCSTTVYRLALSS